MLKETEHRNRMSSWLWKIWYGFTEARAINTPWGRAQLFASVISSPHFPILDIIVINNVIIVINSFFAKENPLHLNVASNHDANRNWFWNSSRSSMWKMSNSAISCIYHKIPICVCVFFKLLVTIKWYVGKNFMALIMGHFCCLVLSVLDAFQYCSFLSRCLTIRYF